MYGEGEGRSQQTALHPMNYTALVEKKEEKNEESNCSAHCTDMPCSLSR